MSVVQGCAIRILVSCSVIGDEAFCDLFYPDDCGEDCLFAEFYADFVAVIDCKQPCVYCGISFQ